MRIIRTLLLSVALLAVGQWLMAEDAVIGHVSLDGLYYNLNTEEQTAAVTWEVKDNAANCTGLTEIVLPDGVTKIRHSVTPPALVMYPFLPAIRNGSSTAGCLLRRMAMCIPLPVRT
ncbi:MAG: hypothetical protein J6Y00_03615 [Paludibacteraceae bacterium]|nr:hypothetical protein [Paludibacteraceae bacterium]